MKTVTLEKNEPKLVEFNEEQQLTDKNIQMPKTEHKESVGPKKEVYKRPDFLYHLL